MRVVDPVKLDAQREWIDREITELCLRENFTRPQAYRSILRDLGHCAHFQSYGEWWMGFTHRIGQPMQLGSRSEVLINQATELIDTSSALLERGEVTEELLERIRSGTEILKGELPRAIASDSLYGHVFGVTPDAVATTLILVALDGGVDLFMDSTRFCCTYPRSEWERIFRPLASSLVSDPNQLMLFEEDADRDHRQSAHVLAEGLAQLVKEGPISLDWEC